MCVYSAIPPWYITCGGDSAYLGLWKFVCVELKSLGPPHRVCNAEDQHPRNIPIERVLCDDDAPCVCASDLCRAAGRPRASGSVAALSQRCARAGCARLIKTFCTATSGLWDSAPCQYLCAVSARFNISLYDIKKCLGYARRCVLLDRILTTSETFAKVDIAPFPGKNQCA